MLKIYTIEDAARILNVTPIQIEEWFKSGRLKGYRLPCSGEIRIPKKNLTDYLNENDIPAPYPKDDEPCSEK